ncbi:unnamed protein product [Mesocestoides corti]|uniref:NR LBD domain-containing protein n=2 Tax=Mesocestoides corti TaxID=53468 RepID=A0A0R3U364_MESCO|nr:unnamed protein product [Mesocestoides corti]
MSSVQVPIGHEFYPENFDDQRLRMHETLSVMVVPHIQQVVEFAKRIPDFSSLTQPDQLVLIKAAFFEVWLVQVSRTISLTERTVMLCDGRTINKTELDFVYTPNVVRLMFEFFESFNALGLNDMDVGLICAVLLTKPDRPGISEPLKVAAIQDRVLAALRYQLASNPLQTSNLIDQIVTEINLLVRVTRELQSPIQWYRNNWYRTRLAPLYSEIYDIPLDETAARVAQAQAYPPIDFNSAALYAPVQTSIAYSAAGMCYITPKTPQTVVHYHHYPSVSTAQVYPGYSNSNYSNISVFTDQPQQQQQLMYVQGQSRWHTSAFEPYSTDMQSTVKALKLEADTVGDVSRDEATSTSAYSESQARSRSQSSPDPTSTASSGFALGEIMSSSRLLPTSFSKDSMKLVDEMADVVHRDTNAADTRTIVAGDDPFKVFQSADLLAGTCESSTTVDTEPSQLQSDWGDLSSADELKQESGTMDGHIPTLIPTPEIMAATEREEETPTTIRPVDEEDLKAEKLSPVGINNGL